MRRFPLVLALLVAASAQAAGAPEPPAEAVLAALPFAPSAEANRVMVDLAPEGARPFVMMLDTGASTSVITPGMARQLGVTVRRNKSTPYRRATRLGRDLQFLVDTRYGDTGSRTGWDFGVLGGEFLDDYVLEIDFPGRTVRFLDPKQYEVPESVEAPDERVVALKRAATRLSLPIQVGGKEQLVMLDTGAPPAAVLSGQAARSLGIDLAALPRFGSMGTVIGEVETRLYEAPSFELGGVPLGVVPVVITPKGWFNQAGVTDSVVGFDALSPFVIRIDYARKRLWLKRVESRPIRFWGADYSLAKQTGAFLTEIPGGHFVWAVLPGSAAAKLGLREGDAIVSESDSAAALPADEILRRVKAGEALTVAREQDEVWVETVLRGGGAEGAHEE